MNINSSWLSWLCRSIGKFVQLVLKQNVVYFNLAAAVTARLKYTNIL